MYASHASNFVVQDLSIHDGPAIGRLQRNEFPFLIFSYESDNFFRQLESEHSRSGATPSSTPYFSSRLAATNIQGPGDTGRTDAMNQLGSLIGFRFLQDLLGGTGNSVLQRIFNRRRALGGTEAGRDRDV